MPVYEYKCDTCGKEFEAFQKITEPSLETCTHCHGPEIRRLISQTSFQLKGSGWYVTDYADKKPSSGSESDSKSESDSRTESKDSGSSSSDDD